jgi:hypothetical protein
VESARGPGGGGGAELAQLDALLGAELAGLADDVAGGPPPEGARAGDVEEGDEVDGKPPPDNALKVRAGCRAARHRGGGVFLRPAAAGHAVSHSNFARAASPSTVHAMRWRRCRAA